MKYRNDRYLPPGGGGQWVLVFATEENSETKCNRLIQKKKKKLYLNSIKAGMYGQLQRRGESRFYLKTQYTLRSRVNLGEAVLLRVFDLGFYRTFWVRVGVSHDVCRC